MEVHISGHMVRIAYRDGENNPRRGILMRAPLS
jgi:hypothetical protein